MKQQKLKGKSLKWIDSKIAHFAQKLCDWKTFWTFECSDFFKGHELAEINKEIYYKNVSYIIRKIRQLKLLKSNKVS